MKPKVRSVLFSASVALWVIGSYPSLARADIVWDWSFDGTSGQFVTGGTDSSVAGIFDFLDFSVSSSTVASIGSVSGGEYRASAIGDFRVSQPYSMNWDGSSVVEWNQDGENEFSLWFFQDLAALDPPTDTVAPTVAYIVFGLRVEEQDGEIVQSNAADQARYFLLCCDEGDPSFLLSVAPAGSGGVPEPGTLGLIVASLFGLALARRKRVV